jgi:nucleotide-binding universal stress UspA family protein
MVDRLLVPVDDSDHARHALDHAVDAFPGATVVLLHVIDPGEAGFSAGASMPSFAEEWYENAKDRADALLGDYEASAASRGVTVERAVEVGRPRRVIVDYAEDHDVDHVIMGSHGREGVTRVLLGSVAEAVLRRSPVPVTVTR